MIPAPCHPQRRHYAKGQCFDCYVKFTWKGNSMAKAGARAKQRRREKLAKRDAKSASDRRVVSGAHESR